MTDQRRTAAQIMDDRSVDDYMSWAIETAGSRSHQRLPRWSHVGSIFGNGSGVSQALCRKYGHDPDEMMGKDWEADLETQGSVECPTCGTEFDE